MTRDDIMALLARRHDAIIRRDAAALMADYAEDAVVECQSSQLGAHERQHRSRFCDEPASSLMVIGSCESLHGQRDEGWVMPHVAQPQEKGTNPLSNWAVGSPEDATAVHSSRCRIDWQRICGTLARLSGASAVCRDDHDYQWSRRGRDGPRGCRGGDHAGLSCGGTCRRMTFAPPARPLQIEGTVVKGVSAVTHSGHR